MTRDEAIKTLNDTVKWNVPNGQFVDAFAALGMLKLEEPKSAEEKLVDILENHGWARGSVNTAHVFFCLGAAGLKIVEK